jgi:hypothetical protein
MSTLSPDQWLAVSPYLDQALDLPDEERQAWLASLREQDPTLAAHLQTLLDEHRVLAQEQYLEEGPSSRAKSRGANDFGGLVVLPEPWTQFFPHEILSPRATSHGSELCRDVERAESGPDY